MEGSDVDGCFAEEADANLVAPPILDREADARGDRHMTADDAVSAEEVGLGVEEVHRAAFAAGDAGLASE